MSLTNLFPAGLYLSRHRVEPWFLDHVRQETESLWAAISDEFNILTTVRSPGEKLRSSRLNEAFAALQEKVNEVRDRGVSASAPLQTAIAFTGHFAAIRTVCDELNNIRSAMEGLPVSQPLPEAKPHWTLPVDWFWKGCGKGGLAVISISSEMDQSGPASAL